MTLAIILVIAAALSLLLVLRIALSRGLRVSGNRNLGMQVYPIDMEAFRNLVDPAEDDYLRRRLSAGDFRRVQRARLRALAAYVRAAGSNAAVLVRMGQDSLAAGDPRTAEAARQLINEALLLRRNAALALLKIYAGMAWPSSHLATAPVFNGYEQLNGAAMLLGRLQNPTTPVRLSATS